MVILYEYDTDSIFGRVWVVFRWIYFWLWDIIGSILAIPEVILVLPDVNLDNFLKFVKMSPKHILKNGFFELARLKQSLNKSVWIWKNVGKYGNLARSSRSTAQRPLVASLGSPKSPDLFSHFDNNVLNSKSQTGHDGHTLHFAIVFDGYHSGAHVQASAGVNTH